MPSSRRDFLKHAPTVSCLATSTSIFGEWNDAPSLQDQIKKTASDLGLPGFVGGVVQNGKLSMVQAEGFANLEKQIPMSRQGGAERALVKGKRWLLLSRWEHLNKQRKGQLESLFALNRRLMKAYLLKESLDGLWTFRYEGAMLRYFENWVAQLRWQRLEPMEKLARMLRNHLDGILNYCRVKAPLGVVEAVNGNLKALLRRGRGYQDLPYLLLKAQRLAATKTEFLPLRQAA